MRKSVLILTSAAFLFGGCATVDMTDMAGPVAAKTEAVSEKNVVERAAAKLYAAFKNKGLTPKTSGKRVQSAASILLNGLENRDLTETDVDYAAQDLPRDVVLADVNYASNQVHQTTKAAEIYLEMAPIKRNLRKELVSLEQALLASREASTVFAKVLSSDSADLVQLNEKVAALKMVTDQFGERVRADAAADMAARRQAETS